jgi:hypothetical protein
MSLASIQDEIDRPNLFERVALIDVFWDGLDEERTLEAHTTLLAAAHSLR